MEHKKKSKEKNYYKISTIVLGVLILIAGAYFTITYFMNNAYQEGFFSGQASTFNAIVQNVNQNGYVEIGRNNETFVLVHSAMIQQTQKNTILTILNEVNQKGFVKLVDNSTETILIKYNPQQAPVAQEG